MDLPLLVRVASDHLFQRDPDTLDEMTKVFDLCREAMGLYEMLKTLPYERIGGSGTRAKQVLAEYMRQMYERKSRDSNV